MLHLQKCYKSSHKIIELFFKFVFMSANLLCLLYFHLDLISVALLLKEYEYDYCFPSNLCQEMSEHCSFKLQQHAS